MVAHPGWIAIGCRQSTYPTVVGVCGLLMTRTCENDSQSQLPSTPVGQWVLVSLVTWPWVMMTHCQELSTQSMAALQLSSCWLDFFFFPGTCLADRNSSSSWCCWWLLIVKMILPLLWWTSLAVRSYLECSSLSLSGWQWCLEIHHTSRSVWVRCHEVYSYSASLGHSLHNELWSSPWQVTVLWDFLLSGGFSGFDLGIRDNCWQVASLCDGY